MENLVLYRKYRPKTFSEIIGQEHIVKTLTNAISSGMISHAYLFAGPRGSGKTTTARLLAKAINCENRKGYEPCNKCSACQEINSGRAIDLIEIDAASNRGIDDIRELKNGIKFAPTRLKYKIFIIDEAHQLSKDAANALLKILEEPPAHAVFILATTEIHKMIPTIVSRCQRFDFRRLTVPEIVKKLKWIAQKENIKIKDEALALIATNSEGSLRDAEGILEQVITFTETLRKPVIETNDIKELLGIVDINLINQFCDLVFHKKTKEAIELLDKTIERGVNPQEFIKALTSYLRKMLLLKINPRLDLVLDNLTGEEKKYIAKQADQIKENDLRKYLALLIEARNKMRYSSIPQLPIELATLEMTEKK